MAAPAAGAGPAVPEDTAVNGARPAAVAEVTAGAEAATVAAAVMAAEAVAIVKPM
jgi:hypothetical protein